MEPDDGVGDGGAVVDASAADHLIRTDAVSRTGSLRNSAPRRTGGLGFGFDLDTVVGLSIVDDFDPDEDQLPHSLPDDDLAGLIGFSPGDADELATVTGFDLDLDDLFQPGDSVAEEARLPAEGLHPDDANQLASVGFDLDGGPPSPGGAAGAGHGDDEPEPERASDGDGDAPPTDLVDHNITTPASGVEQGELQTPAPPPGPARF